MENISNTLDQIVASLPVFKPELSLMATFIICIFVGLFFKKQGSKGAFIISLTGFLVTICFLAPQIGHPTTGFFGMLLIDDMATYSRFIIAIGGIITAIFIQQRHPKNNGDVYSVLIAVTVGLNLLTMTSHWLMAFIAIEMVSIASYILVGYFSENKKQSEAAMKYALFGSVCAAVMLYGLSLVYGLTGNLDFQSQAHLQGLMNAPQAVISIALIFVFVGIGFKLSFVPFHVWSPDVYEGAPTPITAFLSTLPKVATIILFTRLYTAWSSTLFYFSELTIWFIVLVAITTMLIGNLAALRQNDSKRMMAYSSIGHTGFLLMAIFAYQASAAYLLYYLVAYVLMNFATFLFIDQIEQQTKSSDLRSFAGLGKKMPILFTCFTLTTISLVGIPPMIGFFGKLLVFTQVFEVYQASKDLPYLLLLCVGALTSVISLFFYFKIPLYAFLRSSDKPIVLNPSKNILFVLGMILTAAIIVLGIFPSLLLDILG